MNLNANASHAKFIGGFIEAELPSEKIILSVANKWKIPSEQRFGYANARSALAHLLLDLKPKRIFLPSYICNAIVSACQFAGLEPIFFPQNTFLDPNVEWLRNELKSGDGLLAVNYFGKPPYSEFLEFVENSPEIQFIEDCAQSLDMGQPSWGNYCLYSPRKIIGVADGGYIVSKRPNNFLKSAEPSNNDGSHLWRPLLLRSEFPLQSELWFPIYKENETQAIVSSRQITLHSHQLLQQIDALEVESIRKRNYAILQSELKNISFFQNEIINFVPLGFPVRLTSGKRDRLRDYLIENGIFPAIHWIDTPIPSILSEELLTLPCDQRYCEKDMNRIILVVNRFIKANV